MLFRWFVGLNADDEVWDASTFSKNRDRLLEADVAKEFLARVVEQARSKGLTSDEQEGLETKWELPVLQHRTLLPDCAAP